MKSRIFLGLSLIIFFVLFLLCSLSSFADYPFLSPEANSYLENLKEKHRVKEIILEKEYGFIWTVVLPKNDGVETKKVQEAVYNDETGKFEAIYNITYITILNARGYAKVIWESASKFYPYDIPKLCFVFDG